MKRCDRLSQCDILPHIDSACPLSPSVEQTHLEVRHARCFCTARSEKEHAMGQILDRLKKFNKFWDERFEDLTKETWLRTTYRDFSAGLIVAMTAIPMAMGFAIAMGLRPEQGIIAGALACIIGRTFGGSKYQVYGPTAAFIPIIASLMAKYGEAGGGTFAQGHGFLVLCSMLAGVVLMGSGLLGLGRFARFVPASIVVGFTVGIGVSIALANAGDIFGLSTGSATGAFGRLRAILNQMGGANWYALALAVLTFGLTRGLLKVSIFIPAPLLAIGATTLLSATLWADKGILLVRDRFGTIPNNFFVFTPPALPGLSASVLFDLVYFVLAIVFVSGIESLLCSSMADRLAGNRGTPFNPDKEFWGQGLVQLITPLINGFPCTGALARTATSIKAGAVTPLAGYFKGGLKLAMAYYIAPYLESVPMACIGGILFWVATNMIKPAEIREVLTHGRAHTALMIYTAVMVPLTDFLTGVLSALVIYAVGKRLAPAKQKPEVPTLVGASDDSIAA
jgi:SulP family sulfate permease